MTVTIVDYGMGNLRSVANAVEAAGQASRLATTPTEVDSAERLILPGVGSFADAMAALAAARLIEPLRRYLSSDRPFLGICLGLHLLFEHGEEGGGTEGLGVLPGRVVRLSPDVAPGHARLPVPHIGWNQVRLRRDDPLLSGIPDGSFAYFLHSYVVVPADDATELTLTETDYPTPFCSAVARGAVRATQFHPEKSQGIGKRILANFARL